LYTDITAHQIDAHIKSARAVFSASEALIASLALLREDMRAARVQTVGELSAETRARHQEPIRAIAGTIGGVEMW